MWVTSLLETARHDASPIQVTILMMRTIMIIMIITNIMVKYQVSIIGIMADIIIMIMTIIIITIVMSMVIYEYDNHQI